MFLNAGNARVEEGFGFERENAVVGVEAEAEGGEGGGEEGGGGVEEDVFLEEGFGVEGGEEFGEFLVGGGGSEKELDLDFHGVGGGGVVVVGGGVAEELPEQWWW